MRLPAIIATLKIVQSKKKGMNMMLNEDEAKEKQCPYTFNKYGSNSSASEFSCIASGCMAWRWEERMFDVSKERFLEQGELLPEERALLCVMKRTGCGYCGLVGNKI